MLGNNFLSCFILLFQNNWHMPKRRILICTRCWTKRFWNSTIYRKSLHIDDHTTKSIEQEKELGWISDPAERPRPKKTMIIISNRYLWQLMQIYEVLHVWSVWSCQTEMQSLKYLNSTNVLVKWTMEMDLWHQQSRNRSNSFPTYRHQKSDSKCLVYRGFFVKEKHLNIFTTNTY